MLQDFREGLRGITLFIVILIIIPFAFVGIDSIFFGGSAVESEVVVDGEKISKLSVDRALAIYKQRLVSQLGEIDPATLDDAALRGPVTQRLIREKAAVEVAKRGGMAVSPATLAQLLRNAEPYQTDGQFDPQRYEFMVAQLGYTPQSHQEDMGNAVLLNQFTEGVLKSGFVTDTDLDRSATIFEQRRTYHYLTIPLASSLEDISIDSADIETYYQENRAAFRSVERVRVEYIELSAEILAENLEPDADLVREQFEQELADRGATVRRRVQHILIEPSDDQSHLTVMTEIQQKLSEGVDFAELAKTYSADLGSADQGGDLGFVEPGAFPEAFEQALADLQQGQVSEPVETEAGIHLIRASVVEESKSPDFATERPRIEAQLREQMALDSLPSEIEQLRDRSYNAESLAEVATDLDLKAEISEFFSRAGGSGLAAYPAVVKAAFEDEVLNQGYASDVVELGDARVVVLKLSEHLPAKDLPLEEVSDDIVTLLKQERGRELVAQRASSLMSEAEVGASIETLARRESLPWQVVPGTLRFDTTVDQAVRDQAFSVPSGVEPPQLLTFQKSSGDAVVLSLTKVESGSLESMAKTQRERLAQTAADSFAQREYQAYEDAVLAQADVELAD